VVVSFGGAIILLLVNLLRSGGRAERQRRRSGRDARCGGVSGGKRALL